MTQPALIEAVDAALPQTQCGKCGHDGCRPYAEAIAEGEAINRCPPGGEATVSRLAELTGRAALPLEQPAQSPLVARIREAECIGCTKCIQACPVDAILGAAKHMHTVIETECTGCELCVAPCPVDCIDLLPHPDWQAADNEAEQDAYLARRAERGRRRFEARNARLAREEEAKRRRRRERSARHASAATTPAQAQAQQPAQAPATSSSALRASRVSLVASLKRLDRQRQASDLAPDKRDELERRDAELRDRLADIDRQLAGADGRQASHGAADKATRQAERQRRFAVNAAEQARRRARQQLAHAERQRDDDAIAAAHEQIERAERMLAEARAALDPASH
ncbi:RnfABCDGE type electron transport complex subunit B [Halomonas getboli]|uniref:RnfABCDGE type electron transport complex subunit B n=1 Tax=Halomonas getboli TaxID=2935862 RepID=UPI001FFE5CD9|nr:RnfABCDGE type electron transport complex subunit B [Halomonas getboli]MCK2182926.1 RnfABCDGE type electron transport complex subunit B [Halomonas getboli]